MKEALRMHEHPSSLQHKPEALSRQAAARILRSGGLLVYPTETFYALGGSALRPETAQKIYALKRRDKALPLPLIIGSPEQLPQLVPAPGPLALELMRRCWPGPLTILLPALPGLPPSIVNAQGKLALRLSAHPEARRLCLRAGLPLLSTSANLSGLPPASRPDELDPLLFQEGGADLYAAGPFPSGGAPSTIVEPLESDGRLRLIRAGALPLEDLLEPGYTLAE
jgi:L-threonylcarbamoyladenylate synthase